MGDRGNIVVQDQGRVYLYTHWRGSEIGSLVKKALRRKQRWDDSSYLTRIIFDTMTDGHQGGETGFGISSHIVDNEHPVLVVDVPTQTVWFEEEEGNETKKAAIPFTDFIK